MITPEKLIGIFTTKSGRLFGYASKKTKKYIPVLMLLTSYCPPYYTIRERLEVLKIGYVPECKSCGSPSKFLNNRWLEYCSRACIYKDNEYVERRNVSATNARRARPEEMKQQEYENRKAVCQVKFGGNSPLCSPEVRAKMQETMKLRFGVPFALQSNDLVEKSLSTKAKNRAKNEQ